MTVTPIVNPTAKTASQRQIEYLSSPSAVSMADRWFEIASIDHFWVRRRFQVLQHLAGGLITESKEMAEIGCGHGLLQKQIEDRYGRTVAGFDLNEHALMHNVSRLSSVSCYDIFRKDARFQSSFDVIFLFDVIEHIPHEVAFLEALLVHLAPKGKLVLNVPAGEWLYSKYDEAVGHVRRYSIDTLREAAARSGFRVKQWTYWGLPLIPALIARKVWLIGRSDERQIVSAGMDSRTKTINSILEALSRCEVIPQKVLGTSLMAILERPEN